MPRLRTYEIENAKLGSTQLGAVYKGSTQIWKAVTIPPESTLTGTYWSDPVAVDGADTYTLLFAGIHNIQDVPALYCFEYRHPSLGWHIANVDRIDGEWSVAYWPPDVPFEIKSAATVGLSPGSPNTYPPYPGRIKYKLSDGTITEWAYSS